MNNDASTFHRYPRPARVRHLDLHRHSGARQFVTIPDQKGLHIVPFNEIMRLQAMSNYCEIFLVNGAKILSSRTLKSIEGQLPDGFFIKTHQSHIVRTDLIRFVGATHLQLADGKEIPVSRNRKQVLVARFTETSFKA